MVLEIYLKVKGTIWCLTLTYKMKIRISKYGHSFIIAWFGVYFINHFDTGLSWFIGGYLIGYALRLARQDGIENGK